MNCKPGDLAVIVRDEEPAIDVGKIVHVRAASEPDEDGHVWTCDSCSGPLRFWDDDCRECYSAHEIEIPDSWLRPIRYPGDDATDETLLWLPVPTTERTKETA